MTLCAFSMAPGPVLQASLFRDIDYESMHCVTTWCIVLPHDPTTECRANLSDWGLVMRVWCLDLLPEVYTVIVWQPYLSMCQHCLYVCTTWGYRVSYHFQCNHVKRRPIQLDWRLFTNFFFTIANSKDTHYILKSLPSDAGCKWAHHRQCRTLGRHLYQINTHAKFWCTLNFKQSIITPLVAD